MILVIEPYMHGTGHSVINAGLLRCLKFAFPKQQLIFCAEHEHLEEVKRHNLREPIQNCLYKQIVPPPLAASIVERARINSRLLPKLVATFDTGEPIYLLTTFCVGPEAHICAKLARKTAYHRRLWTHFMLHGTSAEAFRWRSRNPFVRRWDLQAAVDHLKDDTVRFLVLDRATIAPLTALASNLTGRIGVLNLPLLQHELDTAGPEPPDPPPLRVGMLGQATEAKGLHSFIRLAKQLTAAHGDIVNFHLIGRLAAATANYDVGPAILHTKNAQARHTRPNQMPRSRYLELARSMHFVCLPYQGTYYHSGASGVFYDAINLARPLIATPTPHVKDSFARFGDIGWLCESEEYMAEVITEQITRFDSSRYHRQVANLETARRAFLPKAIGSDFRTWVAAESPDMEAALR